jgi:hypothetical protein
MSSTGKRMPEYEVVVAGAEEEEDEDAMSI